jgi:hypothetical protein
VPRQTRIRGWPRGDLPITAAGIPQDPITFHCYYYCNNLHFYGMIEHKSNIDRERKKEIRIEYKVNTKDRDILTHD